MADFVYERAGDRFAPTEWAGGPWSRELQHGGPVCGLMAEAAEAAAREYGMRVARLTVDLSRPVPLAPLVRHQETVRRGRRLALLEIKLASGDSEVTRATALLLAPEPGLGSTWSPAEPPPPGPEGLAKLEFLPRDYAAQVPPGFHKSVEARLCEDELGPALWATTPLDLLAGQRTSPLVRSAMLSDLTFGLSTRMLLRRGVLPPDPRRIALINADVTLYLERAPEGDWLAMRHGAVHDREGIAVAEVTQLDAHGRFGRSLQALLASRS